MTITAVEMGKKSAKSRFKGKTKKEISEMMRKIVGKRWLKKQAQLRKDIDGL